MLLIILITAILVIFAAYAVAPIFGLEELYPQVFSDDALNWQAAIVLLVILGGVFWLSSRRKGDEGDS